MSGRAMRMWRVAALLAVAWTVLAACAPRGRSAAAAVAPVDSAARRADSIAARRRTPPLAIRSVATLPVADGVVAVTARGDGRVQVDAAGPQHTVALSFRAAAVDSFVRRSERLLRARARGRHEAVARSVLMDSTIERSVAFTRTVSRRDASQLLLFADGARGSVRLPVSATEAELVLDALRRGAFESRRLSDPAVDSAVRADSIAKARAARRAGKRRSRRARKPPPAATAPAQADSARAATGRPPMPPTSPPASAKPKSVPKPAPKSVPKSAPKPAPSSTP